MIENFENRRKVGIYEKRIKRILDIVCSLSVIIFFSPIFLLIACMVRVKLGTPVLFCQLRPGKDEKIFKMYKFRSMTDEKDAEGNLLSDEKRLTKFGKVLRSTSLDEFPEFFNILKGDMSFVGPRPQLVRDMVFMTPIQRRRHQVLPGLTGLAQVNGRNNISWEEKFNWDLQYIENLSFRTDMAILVKTIWKVFRRSDISTDGMETAEDLGDYLLRNGLISTSVYNQRQQEARRLSEKSS